MADSRSHLLVRKRDLYAALRTLEEDYRDGTIDEDTYRVARQRYEVEAAGILEQLDALPEDDAARAERRNDAAVRASRRYSPWILIGGAASLIIAALVLFLVTATVPRGSNGTLTGD